mmetsp:Transcript_37544/g.99806  ORF Transcript_37544/g.99806 Transcript_37544/m.99806 type:complete len:302 (-) Transcript_37544:69-974(-)
MWISCVFLFVLLGHGQFSKAWSSPEGDWQRLAKQYGTDQGDLFGGTLPLFFEPRRHSVRNVLEIGFYKGASALLLLDYFPNSSYVSIDHTRMADAFFQGTFRAGSSRDRRAQLVSGRQCHTIALCAALNATRKFPHEEVSGLGFDVIIDDGSHWPPDQQCSFRRLFSQLRFGGVYVIEDTFTSYWSHPTAELYGHEYTSTTYGLHSRTSTVAFFKFLSDFVTASQHFYGMKVNGWERFRGDIDQVLSLRDQRLALDIGSITFSSEAIIVVKTQRRNPDLWYQMGYTMPDRLTAWELGNCSA